MRLCLEVAFDMGVKLRLERVSPPRSIANKDSTMWRSQRVYRSPAENGD